MSNLQIRAASAREFKTAVDWAAAEGWNPGLDDLAVFHPTDPRGFLIGWSDGEPVSSISVVRYGETYGFLGFYIVRPEYRGRGFGLATWKAGMDALEGRVVGLDGVVGQQDNYARSGFELAGCNARYSGVPAKVEADPPPGVIVTDVHSSDLAAITAYDRAMSPAPRDGFIRDWVRPVEGARRSSVAAWSGTRLSGFATLRSCHSGYKIGPVFAEDEPIARALLARLCSRLDEGDEVCLDVPEDNKAAVRIAEDAGLEPVFETARMYRGARPDLPINRIFGITTFELG